MPTPLTILLLKVSNGMCLTGTTMRKTLIFFTALIVIIFCTLGLIYYISTHTDRHHDKILTTPTGQVLVHWDQYGIPHIKAKASDLDAYYGLGYAHALDRLWQMDLQRHIVQGRLSEIFGKRTLAKDKYLRNWRFYAAAEQDWQHFNAKSKAVVTHYVQGINDAIRDNGLSLPFYLIGHQPEPWTTIDAIAWQKMMAWDLEDTWEKKISRSLLAKVFSSKESLIHAFRQQQSLNKRQHVLTTKAMRQSLHFQAMPGKGSNSWVVSGHLTTTGKPLLANDIHLALPSPSVVYLAELQGPKLHVIGASLPGLPAIIIGHNDHITWGLTNSYVDTQDLYIETKDKVQAHQEIIRIKGEKAESYTTYTSKQGPIISTVTDAKKIAPWVAIRWPAISGKDTTIQGFVDLSYAKNWDEFRNAIKTVVAPVQNFIYADTHGNIGRYMPGHIPIRHGFDGSIPVPDDANHQWQGFIPFDQLPHEFNPKRGYIVTANNQVVSDSYPYVLTAHGYMPPYRAQRIEKLLQTQQPISIATDRRMQMDVRTSIWPGLKPILLATKPLSQQAQQMLDILRGWSGKMSTDSMPATVFATWFHQIDAVIEEPFAENAHTEDPFFVLQQLTTNGPFCRTKVIKSCSQLLSVSLENAIKYLNQHLGKDKKQWQWGKLHHLRFKDDIFSNNKWLAWLWVRKESTPGGKYTVNVGTYDNNYDQMGGAAYRQIIDLGNFNNSLYVAPLGQSESPLNKHYDDLIPLWLHGDYIEMV